MTNKDNNKFRVTVRGSNDSKSLDDVLIEMSVLIAEIAEKANKKYDD